MSTLLSACAQLLPFVGPVVLVLVWWRLPRDAKARFAVLTVVSGVAAAVLVAAAGAVHSDPRPFVVDPTHPPLFEHSADNGFPSDHTTYAATAALLVATVHRRLGIVLLVSAVLGGLARVAANVHHLQDIVAALVIAVVAVGAGLGVQVLAGVRYTALDVADVSVSRRSLLLAFWVAGCLVVTLGAVGGYVVAQQVGRRAADDVPQVLVTEQVTELSQRAPSTRIPDSAPQVLSSQSGPFVIVYDSSHRVVSTTALLDDATPGVPAGTLDDALSRGRVAVTWQPRSGVREAVVAQPWAGPAGSGVVVAGVGLGATEERAHAVLLIVLTGWAVAVLALTGMLLIARRAMSRRS